MTENRTTNSDITNHNDKTLMSVEDILIDCMRILATEENLSAAVQEFLCYIGGYYGAARAYIFEFDMCQHTFSNTYEWCAEGVHSEISGLQNLPMEYIDPWMEKFNSDGDFYLSSLHECYEKDSVEYAILSGQNIASLMAAPLIKNEETVGFLGVDDPSENLTNRALLKVTAYFAIEQIEKRKMIKGLEKASYVDLLTGVNNRNQYIKTVEAYQKNLPASMGVIFIDMNGMKKCNDTYGHEYGDWLLKQVAKILKENVSEHIYRIGGDEFVVLCPDMSKDAFLEKEKALRNAFTVQGDCNVSIGVIWREGEYNLKHLISRADELMYAEKQLYYKSLLSGKQYKGAGIVEDVLQEIEERKFTVYYQPKVSLKTNEIIGAEALVRKIEQGQVVNPEKFIPYYEQTGIIRHVDFFVLESVCQALKQWNSEGLYPKISVNFSRTTLMEPNVANSILETCKSYGVNPENIMVEITESISKMKDEELRALAVSFGEAGIHISLDDFGVKYSNLSLLTEMYFDEIKMARSLIESLEDSRKSQIIVRNVVNMCRELGNMWLLAEGIENEEQCERLLYYHCEFGQGFLFYSPMPHADFDKALRSNAHHSVYEVK